MKYIIILRIIVLLEHVSFLLLFLAFSVLAFVSGRVFLFIFDFRASAASNIEWIFSLLFSFFFRFGIFSFPLLFFVRSVSLSAECQKWTDAGQRVRGQGLRDICWHLPEGVKCLNLVSAKGILQLAVSAPTQLRSIN